ncbi:hypothetical protein BJV74DRAFT_489750 [Russula compacta]|nr:hypothetical protein BJV74DRAFT_489750 [Russula compacta]
MVTSVRHVAVAITVILHAASGIFLSILALSLQRFFPSLEQLPPSFDHISDSDELIQPYSPSRRDSGYSTHTTTSDGVSSDESLKTPSPEFKDSPDDHVALLLASQARVRAARHSMFTLSSSLWTLTEYPSPKPSQLGEEHGATTVSDVPPDTLTDSPSVASSLSFMPPQEEQLSDAPSAGLKRSCSSHCLPLLPHDHTASHIHSPPLPGLSRRKSASEPHLRVAAALSLKGSSSGHHNHRRTSVTEYVRKVTAMAQGHKGKDGKSKEEERSASCVGRERTDPYQAPYFFPSPVSPWAHDYIRLARLDRKIDIQPVLPPSAPVRPEDDRWRMSRWPGERMRRVWAPSHRRRIISHGSDSWL